MMFMLAFFAWIILSLVFNAIAQKVLPTKVNDSFVKKFGYRVIFHTLPLILLGTVLLFAWAGGH